MAVQTFIDGVEITNIVQDGTSTHRLNKKWAATARVPVADWVDGIGKRMLIFDSELDNPIDFHGYIKTESAEDGEDGDGMVEYTAEDPREIWEWRPARDLDGDFSKPTFLEDFVSGPQIMQAILTASESAGSGPNEDAEGPLFIDFAASSFAGGGVDLSGAPTDWPMMIEEIASLLCDTGELDIILTPVDYGGYMAKVDCFNGNYGANVAAGVTFTYGDGGNTKFIRRVRDMTKLCNKLWYFLGPKCDDQHWRRGLTFDDPNLPDPFPSGITKPAFQVVRDDSRDDYGVRMDIRIYDEAGTGICDADAGTPGTVYPVPLHWRLWETESVLRVHPKTMIHATPVDGMHPTGWDIGDIIGLDADPLFMGGFSFEQRVYERKISWNAEGVVSIAEIVSSEAGDLA